MAVTFYLDCLDTAGYLVITFFGTFCNIYFALYYLKPGKTPVCNDKNERNKFDTTFRRLHVIIFK